MTVEPAGERGRRSERKRESTRSDQTVSMVQRGSMALSICLLDLQERDEAVAQEAAQNSVKKGAHLGPSIESERGAGVKVAWCGCG
jgi:hypothetical protein